MPQAEASDTTNVVSIAPAMRARTQRRMAADRPVFVHLTKTPELAILTALLSVLSAGSKRERSLAARISAELEKMAKRYDGDTNTAEAATFVRLCGVAYGD